MPGSTSEEPRQETVASLVGVEPAAVRRLHPAGVLLPIVVSLAILLVVWILRGPNATTELLVKAIFIGTVMGKFGVLFSVSPDGGFLDSSWKVACLVLYLDLMVGLIAVFNIGLLFRIPRFGRKILDLQQFGRLMVSRNPWMRKMTFAGIIAFVMFPLSGTGAIGGALFGPLLGLSRARTMAGIAVGSVLGSFGMAALASPLLEVLGEDAKNNWIFKYGGLVFLLALVGWLTARYKRMGPGPEEPPART